MFNTQDSNTALIWSRMLHAGVIIIPATFLHFVMTLTKVKNNNSKILLWVYFLTIIFLFADFTPYFICNVAKLKYSFYGQPGMLYIPFLLFFGLVIGYSLHILFNAGKQSVDSSQRNQLKYILLSSIIGYGGGAIDFLPIFGINIYNIGNTINIAFAAITAYAILKHDLMDIRVIINRTGAWILTTVFLASGYLLGIYLYATFVSQKIDALLIVWTILYGIFVGEFHQKIRYFIQTTAEKKFLKSRYDYRKVLSKMSGKLAGCKTMGDITRVLEGDFKEEVEAKSVKVCFVKRSR